MNMFVLTDKITQIVAYNFKSLEGYHVFQKTDDHPDLLEAIPWVFGLKEIHRLDITPSRPSDMYTAVSLTLKIQGKKEEVSRKFFHEVQNSRFYINGKEVSPTSVREFLNPFL